MAKSEKEGLRLVIELTPDEAEEFRRRAKTDDTAFYEGIAKSFVLGMGEVVNPDHVYDDIKLLVDMSEYGRRGDLRARQEWADELFFTREQLEKQPVKDAICSWAVYFGADIEELSKGRSVPHINQFHWSVSNARASSILGMLRSTIKTHL